MQVKKMQDWNLEDNFAGLEHAGLEKKSYMKHKNDRIVMMFSRLYREYIGGGL